MSDGFPLHFIDWLAFHARTRPRLTALSSKQMTLSYRQLFLGANAIAHRLKDTGIKNGDVVAIVVANPVLHFVLIVALNCLGAVYFSITRDAKGKAVVAPNLPLSWALVHGEAEFPEETEKVAVDFTWLTQADLGLPLLKGAFSRSNQACAIATSSGTTGAKKATEYTLAQVNTRIFESGFSDLSIHRDPKVLCMLGIVTTWGLKLTFWTLLAGATMYIGWVSVEIPDLIAKERIRRVYASPIMISGLLRAAARRPIDFHSLTSVWVGGGQTPAPLARQIMRTLCPTLVLTFGSNEAGIVSYYRVSAANYDPRCVGRILPWIEVEAVDEHDTPTPPGIKGALRFRSIRGDFPDRYIGAPEASATAFREGWFYSGDIGSVSAEGLLFIEGRSQDVINTGGRKISPDIIERAFEEHQEIIEAAAFGAKNPGGLEELCIAVVGKKKLDIDALNTFCRERLGYDAPARIFQVPQMPRNEMGKVLREELARMAQQQAQRTGPAG